MVIQHVVFPDTVCDIQEIYFRINGTFRDRENGIELCAKSVITTDTYMNILDLGYWMEHTDLSQVNLEIQAKGNFRVGIYHQTESHKEILFRQEYRCEDKTEIVVSLPTDVDDGFIFFELTANEDTVFFDAKYSAQNIEIRDVKIAVDICTYHRNEQLEHNLRKFQDSSFFAPGSELFGKLKIYVVDNGDDFYAPFQSEFLEICRNSNQGGGTGGFTRGLQEIKKSYKKFPCTHTVFMDDDVEFQIESFYRIYAFYSLIQTEYEDRVLAGRMFRLDQRNIQYTAAEKWNGGNLIHLGGNTDMNRIENVKKSADIDGEYGGWWMCVYPCQITMKQKPFPFFLHCDDVEYGLRQKNNVLTLYGVQVWHETYEYRMSPQIVYYDVRNSFVVNAMQGELKNVDQTIAMWYRHMDMYHKSKMYAEKYLCVIAFWHFGRKKIFFRKKGELSDIQLWISRKEKILKIITPVFRRITEKYVRYNFEKIVGFYRKNREERVWQ